ncbi:MAG: hypothetical protein H7210_10595 [Pyrinomonadaceae bacterium]|nr:hypothetical protein [Phycisphaerales bacterium]
MNRTAMQYAFPLPTPMVQIEDTFVLALLALESLHGTARIRLDVKYEFDAAGRTCRVSCDTAIGDELNLLFTGYLRRELGDESFSVIRVGTSATALEHALTA